MLGNLKGQSEVIIITPEAGDIQIDGEQVEQGNQRSIEERIIWESIEQTK